MVLGPKAEHIMTGDAPDDALDVLARKLISTTEIALGLVGLKDVTFTAISALCTKNEADVQIKIEYTAGKDEYGRGHSFDPTTEEQESLAIEIKRVFDDFLKNAGVHPMSLSVWCIPYYNTVFKT